MNVKELKELLDDFGDHLEVIIEAEEATWDVVEVDTMNFDGKTVVRIEWA